MKQNSKTIQIITELINRSGFYITSDRNIVDNSTNKIMPITESDTEIKYEGNNGKKITMSKIDISLVISINENLEITYQDKSTDEESNILITIKSKNRSVEIDPIKNNSYFDIWIWLLENYSLTSNSFSLNKDDMFITSTTIDAENSSTIYPFENSTPYPKTIYETIKKYILDNQPEETKKHVEKGIDIIKPLLEEISVDFVNYQIARPKNTDEKKRELVPKN